jgi:peroxidase
MIRQVVSRSDFNQTFNQFNTVYFPSFNFQQNVFQTDMAYTAKTQGLNSIMLGTINDLAWKFGTFGMDLQNNLFQQQINGKSYAIDLLAFNINRGRDHGLQPYVKYVQKCLNINITSFSQLSPTLINDFNAQQLASLYE